MVILGIMDKKMEATIMGYIGFRGLRFRGLGSRVLGFRILGP